MTYITNDSYHEGLLINTGNNGQYSCINAILNKIHSGMSYMINKNSKVLFIRFDLRFPDYYPVEEDNKKISQLLKTMRENRENVYGYHFITWCREQSRSKHQHYHCIALLNGNKTMNYYPFLQEVERVWGMILGSDGRGLVDYCNRTNVDGFGKNGVMIKRPTRKAQGEELTNQQMDFQKQFEHCFHWASYLAKENQKSNTPYRVRRYGSTQIPHS